MISESEKVLAIVSILLKTQALDMRNGSVTLHFDAEGQLRKVERNDVLFRV